MNPAQESNGNPNTSNQTKMNSRHWLGLGIFFMGMSFCINFLLNDTGTSYLVIMYILTLLGAGCILKCMMKVF